MSPKAPRSPWQVVPKSERESVILRKSGELLEYLRQHARSRSQRIRLRDLLSQQARLVDADLKAGQDEADEKAKNMVVDIKSPPSGSDHYGSQRPKPHFGPDKDLSSSDKTNPNLVNKEPPTKSPKVGGDNLEEVADPPPVPPIETAPKAEPATDTELVESCQARVIVIKHSINERVGNSMVLLSNNNDSGKDYLNALLIAMKALSAATPSEIKLAMENLEAAYQAVLPTLGLPGGGAVGLNSAPTQNQSVPNDPNLKAETAVPEEMGVCIGLDDHKVSSGLGQLLSEWKLFKPGGLLGNGAGGQNHPLYQTLKDLPMAAITTGRFEGATPKVRQNISDHMKGWYYEQEIKYLPNETFTGYLRRVVCKIIKNHSEASGANQSNQALNQP